jgi:hypothetical protein
VLVGFTKSAFELSQTHNRVVVYFLGFQDAVEVLGVDNLSAGVSRRHFVSIIEVYSLSSFEFDDFSQN